MQTDAPVVAEPAAPSLPWGGIWAGAIGVAAAVATAGMIATGAERRGLFLPALCMAVAMLAACFDAATSRIPNPLTYTAILLGLATNSLSLVLQRTAPRLAAHWLGAGGPSQSLLGLLLFGGIGLVGVFFAGMGGGDMKLLGAIGALLGLSRASEALLCGAAIAVVYALVNLLISGRLNAVCRTAAIHLLNLVYLREWTLSRSTDAPSRRTIPLAIPLLAGLMVSRVPVVEGFMQWLIRAN